MVLLLGYLTADLVVRALPASHADRLARLLARLVFALRLRSRAVLEGNLARVLGLSGAALRRAARDAFENFALSFVDYLRLRRLDPATLERRVEVHGWIHLERARARGHGLILLSAHLGSWEWGAAFLAAKGLQVHVVARAHSSPGVRRFMERARASRGVGMCEGAPIWPRASRLLRGRACLAVMGDRARTPHGSPLEPPRWAAALARRTGAALLPGVIVRRRGGRYAVYLGPALSPEECRRGEWRRVFERYVRRFPEQWFAFEPWPDAAEASS